VALRRWLATPARRPRRLLPALRRPLGAVRLRRVLRTPRPLPLIRVGATAPFTGVPHPGVIVLPNYCATSGRVALDDGGLHCVPAPLTPQERLRRPYGISFADS
jgi:hypothetical protein